jgi:hypothetical protein
VGEEGEIEMPHGNEVRPVDGSVTRSSSAGRSAGV